MKRVLCLLLVALLFLSLAGCAKKAPTAYPVDSIKTYREIPGLTETDKAAVAELLAGRESFAYGALLATEAFQLPDGTLAGFAKEFCDLLSGLFEIDFVLDLYDWDELMDGLETGTIDFTGELTPTEERMQTYSMTPPIAERMLRIFMREDSEIKTEADLTGLRIGFLTDSITAESIRGTYHIPFISVDVNNYDAGARMLKNGLIDAFIEEAVADPAFSDYDFIRSQIIFHMVHSPVSMTAFDTSLAPIITAVSSYIDAGGLDKLYNLYRDGDFEYSKHKLRQSFTDDEKAYLDTLKAQGGTVAVGFEHDNYPVSFYNVKDDAFEGIAIDVLDEISRLTGIEFSSAVSEDTTWSQIFDKLNAGEIHMVAQLLKSEVRMPYFLWSEVPYARSFYALMSKADAPHLEAYQVKRMSVGATKDSAKIDIFYELFPDHGKVVEYSTQDKTLDALEREEVELIMASEYMLLTQINYREKSGFKINIKLDAQLDSYFGFLKSDAVLCSIISRAQQYVNVEVIEMSWTGRNFDYSKRLAEESARSLTIFLIAICVVLAVTVIILFKNIKLSQKLKDMAHNDPLTGIYNRRFFMELATFQMARSTRTSIDCFIMIFDLDHFKAVNDTHGHLAGDEVLREVARRVKNTIRPYDVLGRYGGEEFIVLITDVIPINKDNALNAAERIRNEICKMPVVFEETEIPVSASIGIAYAAPVNDLAKAIKLADEALYVAKETGRNRVVFYGDENNPK